MNVEAIPEIDTSIEKIHIQQIQDKITAENEKNTYEFISSEPGTYRFELSNIPDNVSFRMYLYNSENEQLDYDSGLYNGGGLTCNLDANKKYFIAVEQGWNTGSYTLNMCSQKPVTDITDYNKISDYIQYTNQRNIYSISTPKQGRYRFELSNVPDNVSFRMYVYNSDFEQIEYDSGLYNGGGLTCNLEANKKYFIVVEQGWNTGSYILNVGVPKPYVDISTFNMIRDSIQYTEQINYYAFMPDETMKYRFELSDIANNVSYKMYIFNSDLEQLEYDSGLVNGRGLTYELTDNTIYYIAVEQGWNYGKYQMRINKVEN